MNDNNQINIEENLSVMNAWDERYASEDYLFGIEPNAFLVSQRHLLRVGMSCLVVADGEGRNGVWLAQQGLHVLSVVASAVALEKAKKLAQQHGVAIDFEQADLANAAVGMKWGKQAIRVADARKCGFLEVPFSRWQFRSARKIYCC